MIFPLERVNEVIENIRLLDVAPPYDTKCDYNSSLIMDCLVENLSFPDMIKLIGDYTESEYSYEFIFEHQERIPSVDDIQNLISLVEKKGVVKVGLCIHHLNHAFVLVNTEHGIYTIDSYIDCRKTDLIENNILDCIPKLHVIDKTDVETYIDVWNDIFRVQHEKDEDRKFERAHNICFEYITYDDNVIVDIDNIDINNVNIPSENEK
jgi:hypothetical protein